MDLSSPPLPWDAEGLWLQLSALLPSISVEVVARCASTNTELLERARRHGSDPCLLVAEAQTGGRGRLGRAWTSAPGASLTFSLGLPMALSASPAQGSGLSLAVGLALAEALDPPPGAPAIGLKWPNDLWRLDAPGRGRKLGGVLIETVAAADRRVVVVGVGLNVRPLPVADAASGVACLQEDWAEASAPAALHRVAEPLLRALQAFEHEGFAPLAERYAARDLLRGRPVRLHGAGAPSAADGWAEGLAEGVEADGRLRWRTAGGQVHLVGSGEVSLRLGDGAPSGEGGPC